MKDENQGKERKRRRKIEEGLKERRGGKGVRKVEIKKEVAKKSGPDFKTDKTEEKKTTKIQPSIK